MESIKVSVIIPVYNADEFLANTLSDIVSQTLKEIEIICVDDGSTDQSINILKEWQTHDSRIQIITQNNQYAGVARNHGLDFAQGKYVIFWDSDDMFKPNALELLYKRAEETHSDICICSAQRYNQEKQQYTQTNAYLRKDLLPSKKVFNKYDIPKHIFNITTNVPWNKLYRKDFIIDHKLQYQKIKQANDTYFTIMALYFAEKITFVDQVLITYRTNNQKSLSGKASDTVFCAYDSWLYTKNHLEKCDEYALVKNSFLNRALSGFFHSLNIQTTFDSYSKLYNHLVTEGFARFDLTNCKKEDIYISWM